MGHASVTAPLVRAKLEAFASASGRVSATRAALIDEINSHVLGNGVWHGATWCPDFEEVDSTLGARTRSILQQRHVLGRRRSRSASRLTLHAPQRCKSEPVNDNHAKRQLSLLGGARHVTGYGLIHYHSALAVGSVVTWFNALSAVSDIPGRLAAHSRYAYLLWQMGVRSNPLSFTFEGYLDCLDRTRITERAVWNLATACGGRFSLRLLVGEEGLGDSALRSEVWPGWPADAQLLWSGRLFARLPDGSPRSRRRSLMNADIHELANVCNSSGTGFVSQWQDLLRQCPLVRFGNRDRIMSDLASLISELDQLGVAPVPYRPPLQCAGSLRGQGTLLPTVCGSMAGLSDGQLRRAADRAHADSGDDGEALLSAIARAKASPEAVTRAEFDEAWKKLLGSAVPRPQQPSLLEGPSRYELDGSVLSVQYTYERKLDASDREWKVVVNSGHRFFDGMRPDWQSWYDDKAARWFIDPGGEGWLEGDTAAPDIPAAVAFWRDCEERLRECGRKPNAVEADFVFKRVLLVEAQRGGGGARLYFAASDGSRAVTEDETIVSRAAMAHDGVSGQTFGGRLHVDDAGFERHSYEAEGHGFDDVIASLPDGATLTIITDCLSRMSAVGASRRRTNNQKANRYRAERIEHTLREEGRLTAVHWIWVHSHVGITPNEAADSLLPMDSWNEPPLPLCRFHLFAVEGVKRSLGRFVLDSFQYLALAGFAGKVTRTLLPTASTWAFYRDAHSLRTRLLRQAEIDVLHDLRADRFGLWHERPHHPAARGSLEHHYRRSSECPPYGDSTGDLVCCDSRKNALGLRCCCGATCVQDRWHVLSCCSGPNGSFAPLRAKAIAWMVRQEGRFDRPDFCCALRALQGSDMPPHEREMAVRFLLALPTTPGEDDGELAFARGLAVSVYRPVIAMFEAVSKCNMDAAVGDGGKSWRSMRAALLAARDGGLADPGGRLAWWRSCGIVQRFAVIRWARRCLRALRLAVFTRGPRVDAALHLSLAQARERAAALRVPVQLSLRVLLGAAKPPPRELPRPRAAQDAASLARGRPRQARLRSEGGMLRMFKPAVHAPRPAVTSRPLLQWWLQLVLLEWRGVVGARGRWATRARLALRMLVLGRADGQRLLDDSELLRAGESRGGSGGADGGAPRRVLGQPDIADAVMTESRFEGAPIRLEVSRRRASHRRGTNREGARQRAMGVGAARRRAALEAKRLRRRLAHWAAAGAARRLAVEKAAARRSRARLARAGRELQQQRRLRCRVHKAVLAFEAGRKVSERMCKSDVFVAELQRHRRRLAELHREETARRIAGGGGDTRTEAEWRAQVAATAAERARRETLARQQAASRAALLAMARAQLPAGSLRARQLVALATCGAGGGVDGLGTRHGAGAS